MKSTDALLTHKNNVMHFVRFKRSLMLYKICFNKNIKSVDRISVSAMMWLFIYLLTNPQAAQSSPVDSQFEKGISTKNLAMNKYTWTLEKLLQNGGQNNPRVSSSLSSLSAADLERDAAWQAYLPTPSIQASRNDNGQASLVLSVSQTLWSGGRISGAIDSATGRALSARATVSEAQLDIASSIISSFESYLQASLRQENLSKFEERLYIYRIRMNNRVASGVSPENESQLLDARIATNASLISLAKEQVNNSLTKLSQLTGVMLNTDNLSLISEIHELPKLEEILLAAERNNPTLVRLGHEISVAEAEVKQNSAELYPVFSLVAQHTIFPGGGGANKDDSSVALQMSMSTGSGGSVFRKAEAAQEKVYALMLNRDAVMQEMQESIREDYEKITSLNSRMKSYSINIKAAEGVLASYERLFIAGKRSWQDVMNAARDLLDANLAMSDAIASQTGIYHRLNIYTSGYIWLEGSGTYNSNIMKMSNNRLVKQK